ncbi:uncharacterized protein LOC129617803 [Condylostylus longicornis]|uniref:uncharacterized protein LOC129617803 n=1 Tax=Condylostylus longicornis TaxID=2530218 RepID=UPI00244DBC8B|nr:uncharacterized protein LOC129617803 [Condylostylus longicornis]
MKTLELSGRLFDVPMDLLGHKAINWLTLWTTCFTACTASVPGQRESLIKMSKYALNLLKKQLSDIQQDDSLFSVDLIDNDFFKWEIWFVGPAGTLYENGSFHAVLNFPDDFPNNPPTMKITEEMWHPNIYADGTVCISILHPPGTDEFNEQETADERWRPILGVETIMVSFMSLLSSPNVDSPANVDAAIEMKTNPEVYKRKVRKLVEKTLG